MTVRAYDENGTEQEVHTWSDSTGFETHAADITGLHGEVTVEVIAEGDAMEKVDSVGGSRTGS